MRTQPAALRIAAVAVALLPLSTRAVRAQEVEEDTVPQHCLAADTTTQWREVARLWQEGADDPGSDPMLRARLLRLEERDQAVRPAEGFTDSIRSEAFRHRLAAADSANQAALMEIVAQNGWPTRSMVGKEGASAAFLIAQHAPLDVQEKALALMLALPAGEVSPSDLAMLQDRVLAEQGKPQLYGSQLSSNDGGKTLVFDSIADPAHVDARRAQVGLYPLSVYACIVGGEYGVEVKMPGGASTEARETQKSSWNFRP